MPLTRSIPLAILAIALAGVVPAQTFAPPLVGARWLDLPVPNASPTVPFGASAAARFAGYRPDLDLAVVVGSEIEVMVDFGVYLAPVNVGPGREVVRWAAEGDELRDRLVVLRGPRAVRLTWIGPGSPEFDPANPTGPGGHIQVETLAVGGGWDGASALRAGRLTIGGPRAVAALAGDRLSVLTLLDDGQGGMVAGPIIPLSQPAEEFTFADLDGDGSRELVACGAQGVEARRQNGAQMGLVPGSGTSTALTKVRRGDGSEQVAWLTSLSASGPSVLTMLGAQGPTGPSGTLAFGGIVDVIAADHDEDGDEDLVITHTLGRTLHVLANQDVPGTVVLRPFEDIPPHRLTWPLGPPPGSTPSVILAGPASGRPLVMDLDNDGDGDWLVPVHAGGMISAFANQQTAEDDQTVELRTISYEPATETISIGFAPRVPGAVTATHIQVVTHANSGGATPAKPEPWLVEYVELGRARPDLVDLDLDAVFQGTDLQDAAHFVQHRLVRVEGGRVVEAWKSTCAAIIPGSDPAESNYVLSLPGFPWLAYYFGPNGDPRTGQPIYTSESQGDDEGKIGLGNCTPAPQDEPPLPPPPPLEDELPPEPGPNGEG